MPMQQICNYHIEIWQDSNRLTQAKNFVGKETNDVVGTHHINLGLAFTPKKNGVL
jgi:hypothetical protein